MPDDPYFTVEEARARPALEDETDYPDEAIEDARAGAEQAIEDACGVAFVPRTITETLHGGRSWDLLLKWPKVRSVTDLEIAGTALTEEQLAAVVVTRSGRLATPSVPYNTAAAVTYEHGEDQPPFRIKRAAILLTEHFLVASGINERATRVEAGDERMWLSPREPFGIGEVDAAVRDHTFHVGLL